MFMDLQKILPRSLLLFCIGFCVAGIAQAANHTVYVGGTSTGGGYGGGSPILGFSPAQMTINVGDTVTFTSLGGAAHNVHADNGSFRCANGCDNDGHGSNGTPSADQWIAVVTFNQAGVVSYRCDLHGSMGVVGSITVNGAAPQTMTLGGFVIGNWYDPASDGIGFQIEATTAVDLASGLPVMLAYWFAYAPQGGMQS
jgi:plastocyanin